MNTQGLNAFDADTLAALEAITARGVDRFGEPLFPSRAVSHERVVTCLEQQGPMRLAHIAARLCVRRDAVAEVCDRLERGHVIKRDDEAFFAVG
jgi:hypothetical protein